MTHRYTIAAFFALASSAHAQDVTFDHLSIEHGLSQSSVFAIAQDPQGFLWFATQDGLNRYDGYAFTVFRHDPSDSGSISDNYVTALSVDRAGRLWAGTRGAGLSMYHRESGRFTRHRTGSASGSIRTVLADRQGTIWAGADDGLFRVNAVSGALEPFDIPGWTSGQLVESLYEDAVGGLWVGMMHSLAVIDSSRRTFRLLELPRRTDLVQAICQDTTGRWWIAAQEDLWWFDGKTWERAAGPLRQAGTLPVRRMMRDGAGRLWFGGDDGLRRFEAIGRTTVLRHRADDPRSLSGNSILSLFEDRSGVVWVGTYDGINRYAPSKHKFQHVHLSAGEAPERGWNKVRAFAASDDRTIWVATQEGLMRYDRPTGGLHRVSFHPGSTGGTGSRLLWTLLAERDGSGQYLWVGTNGYGLLRLKLNDRGYSSMERFTPGGPRPAALSGPSVVALRRSRDGSLWVGTLWDGLERLDAKRQSWTSYRHHPSNPNSLSSNEIWSLHEDPAGRLWVGTAGAGLNRLDPATGEVTRFRHDPGDPASLADDKVLSIAQTDPSGLWVGTYGGLVRFDLSDGRSRRYTTADGLPNNVVYGIVPDGRGSLWLSTNMGLSRFDPKEESFRNFDANDGLQSNEFNHGAAHATPDGALFFGGVNGFNVFHPGSLRDNPHRPAVVFTDLKVFDRSVQPGPTESRLTQPISQADVLRLSYRDAVFSISYAAIEYTDPLKNQYAIHMSGFDPEWRAVGTRREATYTNLDPGTYTFRVRASNNDGVWNEVGAALRIEIAPPFWATWWFRGLLIAGFLSIGPAIYYRRVTALKRSQALQQEFSRRLIDSQEAERQRIAAELHDSIGQDLLVIKNRLALSRDDMSRSPEAAADFQETLDHVGRSLTHVREISRNLRPVQLDQIGLTAALESVIETVSDASHIEFTATFESVDRLLSKEGEINLFRIVQEALTNILKHAEARRVRVALTRSATGLTLEIEDDGKGLRMDRSNAGLGLRSMQERANMLGGDLKLGPGAIAGTRVTLTIPLGAPSHG